MPKKGCYSNEALKNAIRDVQNGTSYRDASKKYSIPKSTIEFKIKNPDRKETFGPSPILSVTEENILVKWIEDTARAGFPKKANDLKTSVQKFLNDNPRPNPFLNNRPGDGWLKAFLKRHPNISERTSEAVTSASSCVAKNDIRKWFSEIQEYIEEKKLADAMKDPSRIYNGDETGFQICPSTGKVFAAKGTKNVYSIDRGSTKENITVMFTFSADGKICCPMIIYPYQRIPEKIVNSVNADWGIGRSDNGWMTSETFYQYIEHVFYPHLVSNKIKFPVILFVDGHKSHLSYELSVLCNKLEIEVIALYPNATRILQPADVSVFRPVKVAWRQGVRKWQEENPGEVLNKVSFAPLLEKVINTAVKPEILINGFRACGLYPFDPNLVDFSKCLGGANDKSPAPHSSKEALMSYQTFSDIVGEERLARFEQINELLPDDIKKDDFLALFKIWTYFQQDMPVSENIRMEERNVPEEETNPKINVISNVLIHPLQTELMMQQRPTASSEISTSQNDTNDPIISKAQNDNIPKSHENTSYCLQNKIVVVADVHRSNNSDDSNSIESLKDPEKNLTSMQGNAPCLQNEIVADADVHRSDGLTLNGQNSIESDKDLKKKLTSIENYVLQPIAPQRKGKKNSEKFPFAITSKKYQDMIEAKRFLKEEEEARKRERKRKREETKLNNQKKKEIQSKKKKEKDDLEKCFMCKRLVLLRTKQIKCDGCKCRFHVSCIPKTHKNHIPEDDEDTFLCHICYKEESDNENDIENYDSGSDRETDELFQLYREHTENNK